MTTLDKTSILETQLNDILADVKVDLKQLCYDNADKTDSEIQAALPVKALMRSILEKMPRVANEAGETDDDRMPIDRESDLYKLLRFKIDNEHLNRLQEKEAYNIQYYQTKDPAGVLRWYEVPKNFKLPENTLTWTCTGSMARPGSGWKLQKGDPKEWGYFLQDNRKKMQAAARQAFLRLSPPRMKGEGGATTANYGEKFAKNHYAKIVSLRDTLAKEGFMPCSTDVVKKLLNAVTIALGLSGDDDQRAKITKHYAK